MLITKNNLCEVCFENQDAKLLIEDVVLHTSATLYYYHNIEITVQMALDIWHRAIQADEEELEGYTVSFMDCLNKRKISQLLCS